MRGNNLIKKTNTKSGGSGRKKQTNSRNSSKQKIRRTKIWFIVGGIMAGVIVAAGIIIGVLVASGIFNNGGMFNNDPYPADVELKPIIYLYPEKETDVTVKLGAPEKITASYPKYTDGWNVTAYPNGDLVDKSDGNRLYSLYWEGERDADTFNLATGFVVSSENVANFLEEKLSILGLNYREKEEFIVYWLPRLEANDYNYIYFMTNEEIDAGMPLEFSVQPDTIIRVRMVFRGLDNYEVVEEQILEPAPERDGFTVVEWGGVELRF